MQVYAGPLAGGARAVALFNRHHPEYPLNNITVTWSDVGCDGDAKAVVRDLYVQKVLGTFKGVPHASPLLTALTGKWHFLAIIQIQKGDCAITYAGMVKILHVWV